jgi:DNA-directed RNA polymerase subunit omega
MIYPSIDKILNVVDSKYALVYIVANRSKEMIKSNHFQMPEKNYKSAKPNGRALEEVYEGLIHIHKKNDK